jgi:hypothetical protein
MNRSDNFVRVYRAANATEAHVIRGLLEQHDIKVRLLGESLSSGFGELPAEVIEVEIHVPSGYRQFARQLIDEYEIRPSVAADRANDWKCKACGELNPATFGLCWNCQRAAGK